MVSTRCCDHKPRETGWGYTRIMGELKKLGGKPPSRTTVKNILKENGFDSGPKRGEGSWNELLKMHAGTLIVIILGRIAHANRNPTFDDQRTMNLRLLFVQDGVV